MGLLEQLEWVEGEDLFFICNRLWSELGEHFITIFEPIIDVEYLYNSFSNFIFRNYRNITHKQLIIFSLILFFLSHTPPQTIWSYHSLKVHYFLFYPNVNQFEELPQSSKRAVAVGILVLASHRVTPPTFQWECSHFLDLGVPLWVVEEWQLLFKTS